MQTRRLIGSVMAAAGIATCHGAAFGALHKCVDPVTKKVSVSDLECEPSRAPTAEEIAASAVVTHDLEIAKEAQQAAVRADRQLLNKFPGEFSHRKSELTEINEVMRKIQLAMKRYRELVVERKPLDEQAAFYVGKAMPAALRLSLDASNASFAALTDLFRADEIDVGRIVARYAVEREHLRKLWAGSPPGSIGMPAIVSAPRGSK